MADFRTYHLKKRLPAIPMQPVVDPADWCAQSLGPVDDWAYRITEQDQDELLAAAAHFRKLALPLPAITAESFPLPKLKHVLADIRRELIDGRGIVMVRDFPIDRLEGRASRSPIWASAPISARRWCRTSMATSSVM